MFLVFGDLLLFKAMYLPLPITNNQLPITDWCANKHHIMLIEVLSKTQVI